MERSAMSNPSTGFREVEKVLRDAKEILIPYQVAKVRYGAAVATILDSLRDGRAQEAQDKQPEQFKWYLLYAQPNDPSTKDPESFVAALTKGSRVFLVCRG